MNKQKSYKNNIKYSIIIPIPTLEPLIQSYRFKYNFFAKKGIPTHITFLYLFSHSLFIKNKETIIKILNLLPNFFKNKKLIINDFYQNPQMFALDFNKKSSDFIHKIQMKVASYLNLNLANYENPTKRPHITLFTKRGNSNGFKDIPLIKKELSPLLPLTISFDRIWLLEIDIKRDIPTLIYEVKF
jgi:hypothetical protein